MIDKVSAIDRRVMWHVPLCATGTDRVKLRSLGFKERRGRFNRANRVGRGVSSNPKAKLQQQSELSNYTNGVQHC